MKKPNGYFLKIFFSMIGIPLLLSCGCSINKSDIKLVLSEPLPHAQLLKMQAMAPIEKRGVVIFGRSKKYVKSGLPVILLKGSAYEMGYARGVLLKSQIREWIIDCTYMIKKMGLGDIGLNLAMSRAKRIEQFIPLVYKDELMGLSAGCGIDYQTILMLNVLDTIGKQFACTSVAVKDKNDHLLRSRSLDFKDLEFLKPSILSIYQPDQGNDFACVGPVGNISVFTAINEKGLTFGVHDISGSTPGWKGIPAGLLYRTIIQTTDTVDEAENILRKTFKCLPQMAMISDLTQAAIFEFNSKHLKTIKMEQAYLILTNYTRALNIGRKSSNSIARYQEAASFLNRFKYGMTIKKLIELHRQPFISTLYATIWKNIHSAVFDSTTLDFWVAVDSPEASRGEWIGFNLARELYPDKNILNPVNILPLDYD
ncbi:C45 family autoproteolytic acyltransferase/hydolase [Desulfobacula sp.]